MKLRLGQASNARADRPVTGRGRIREGVMFDPFVALFGGINQNCG